MAGTTFTRRQPARAAGVEPDVKVPFFQAAICGALMGLLSLMTAIALAIKERWAWWIPPLSSLSVFAITMTIVWAFLLGAHRKLLWLVEEITGQDIDGDDQKGKPQNETTSVVHEFVDKENRRIDRYPFSTEMEEIMKKVAVALNNGRSFSRRGLKGVVSESDYNRLLGVLQERNLVFTRTPDSPNAGYELSAACKKIFRHYL